VVAVLIILLTNRGRVSSLVFSAAWVSGNVVAISIAIMFAGRIKPPRQWIDLPYEGLMTALLGLGLVVTAWLSRRVRGRSEEPDPPRWVSAVDNLSPFGGAVVAFSNATTSPKNLALAIAAGIAISNATRHLAEQAVACLLYVVVASLTVVTPVVLYFVAGGRATLVLNRWKQRITARAAVGMELMLFVLGIGLACKGILNLLT
jgi:hypothetical protein